MNRTFYFLWTTISGSTLALSIYTMTITVLVLSLTNSATLASLVMLGHVLGKLCSSFVFPLLSNKTTLQKILTHSLLIQLALYLAISVAVMLESQLSLALEVFILLLLVVCIGFIDGFVSPSRKALIPETVQQERIAKANSYVSTSDQSLALLGWSLGPIAMNYYHANSVLGISIVLSLTACLASFFIGSNVKRPAAKQLFSSPWKAMGAGWGILFSTVNHMRTITLMDILEGIASGIWIGGITLVFVSEVLHEGKQWWGYINASYYVGSVAGGILVAILATRLQKHLITSIVVSSFAVSLLVFLYAMNTFAWLALLLVIFMGPCYQLRDISQNTYIQMTADNDSLSKLYAAKDNIYYFVFSLSVFIMGFIADYIGIKYVYYVAGILYLLSAVLATIRFKAITRKLSPSHKNESTEPTCS